MPSKKKKYNARFPAGRIKKIMQTDEEVGKVAQAVPVIISRTLELFVHSLLTKTMQVTSAKNAKTLSPSHMKQCILSESRFDFLKDLVKGFPDITGPDEEVPTPPLTPAPIAANSLLSTTCLQSARHSVPSIPTDIASHCDINITPVGTRDSKGSSSSSTTLHETAKVASLQAPDFQMSVPTSFNVSQPNFYTEVNPANLATGTSCLSASNKPMSNFTHTANIDEDYDT